MDEENTERRNDYLKSHNSNNRAMFIKVYIKAPLDSLNTQFFIFILHLFVVCVYMSIPWFTRGRQDNLQKSVLFFHTRVLGIDLLLFILYFVESFCSTLRATSFCYFVVGAVYVLLF